MCGDAMEFAPSSMKEFLILERRPLLLLPGQKWGQSFIVINFVFKITCMARAKADDVRHPCFWNKHGLCGRLNILIMGLCTIIITIF